MKTIKYFTLLLPIIFSLEIDSLSAQQTNLICLKNSSFEGTPKSSTVPDHWHNCGHSQESPPDIQPNGGFNVTQTAYSGQTYIGLVSRNNKTWEAIGQRLSIPLKMAIVINYPFMPVNQ